MTCPCGVQPGDRTHRCPWQRAYGPSPDGQCACEVCAPLGPYRAPGECQICGYVHTYEENQAGEGPHYSEEMDVAPQFDETRECIDCSQTFNPNAGYRASSVRCVPCLDYYERTGKRRSGIGIGAEYACEVCGSRFYSEGNAQQCEERHDMDDLRNESYRDTR